MEGQNKAGGWLKKDLPGWFGLGLDAAILLWPRNWIEITKWSIWLFFTATLLVNSPALLVRFYCVEMFLLCLRGFREHTTSSYKL